MNQFSWFDLLVIGGLARWACDTRAPPVAGPRSIGRTPRPGAAVTSKSPDAPDVAMLYVEAVMEVRPRTPATAHLITAVPSIIRWCMRSHPNGTIRRGSHWTRCCCRPGPPPRPSPFPGTISTITARTGAGCSAWCNRCSRRGKPWTRSRSTSDSRTPGAMPASPCRPHVFRTPEAGEVKPGPRNSCGTGSLASPGLGGPDDVPSRDRDGEVIACRRNDAMGSS